jgi:iron complex outermembrane receptor protein
MMLKMQRRAARPALLAATSGAVLLGFVQGAHAQAANTGSQVGEVVVTAQRRSQNIQDVPISVLAVSARELTAAGIKNTQDLGQITPNVTIISPIGAGNQPLITIRGIGLNDFSTNNAGPNGVYVDDIYISAPSAQNMSLFDVSQVQVLKGPQGTLYGRNTVGGALVFTDNRPTDDFSGNAHVEYGNYNTLQVEGAVSGPITPNLAGRISAVYNHSDGYFRNALTGSPIDNVNNEAIRLQLLYKPNDKLKIYFASTIGYVKNHPQPYGHVGVLLPGTQGLATPTFCTPAQANAGGCVDLFGYGTPPYWKGSFNREQNLTNLAAITQFRVDYDVGPVVLTSITSWQYDDKFHPEETDASPNNLITATYGVHSNTYTQEFRAAHSSKDFNWVVGAYYLHELLTQNQPLSFFYDGDKFGGLGIPAGSGNFDTIAQISYDKSAQTIDSGAVFGQGDYTFDQLTLTLGARYTWERKAFDYSGSTQFQNGGLGNYGPLQDFIHADNSQTNSNVTWRAALNYAITPQVRVYASVATGFKSAAFNGTFLSNDPAQAALQLQPIKPETVTTYEIGEKASFFDRRLVLDSAIFYNDYRNEQVFATVTQTILSGGGLPIQTTASALTNAPKAFTEGVEVELTAAPFHGLTLNLQPAWLNTHLSAPNFAAIDNKELANAPHFTMTAVADYRWDLPNGDDIDFRWNSNFRGHYFFDSTNDAYIQQNAYWLHNLNVTYQSSKHWEVGVFVHNVTNQKYQLTSSDISAPFGFLEPVYGSPTMYGVQASYNF